MINSKLVIKLNNGLKLQRYGNGSFAFFNSRSRWQNIPSELAKWLIENQDKKYSEKEMNAAYGKGFKDGVNNHNNLI